MPKYYAVQKGRKPGIYHNWPDCQKQVQGFKGAIFKSFPTLKQAQTFMAVQTKTATATKTQKAPNWTAQVTMYTDGGTRNTGNVLGGHVKASDKAAWAYLIQSADKEFSGTQGCLGATNNQMELTALQMGLQRLIDLKLNGLKIAVVMDSKYVLNAINQGWLAGWQRRGWKKASGATVLNVELWQQIAALLPQFPQIKFVWTKGHADNAGNVFVDELLNRTMDQM